MRWEEESKRDIFYTLTKGYDIVFKKVDGDLFKFTHYW